MDQSTIKELEQFAVYAAQTAGKITLEYFRQDFQVEYKEDSSPVTIADRKCEEELRELIGREFPDHAILGEEFGQSGTSESLWILDPIDGTKPFVAGVPQYTVLIGFTTDDQGLVGVIHSPALDRTMSASRGNGCWVNGRQTHVSTTGALRDAKLLCSDYAGVFKRSSTRGAKTLCGCEFAPGWGDAFGHSLVAEGKCDAMLDAYLHIWDTAAVKVCIEEAGGVFTDWQGNSHLHVPDGMSANPLLHAELLEIWRDTPLCQDCC